MNEIRNSLATVFAATEAQAKSQQSTQHGNPVIDDKAAIALFIKKWDEFVRYLIQVGNLRGEEQLKQITMYDFMSWLRGQGV